MKRIIMGLVLLLVPLVFLACTAVPSDSSPVEAIWGTFNPGNPMRRAGTLSTDPQENIYVIDTGNARIQKFDRTGGFVTMWGSAGQADGQFVFTRPYGNEYARAGSIAVDSSGRVYVVDANGGVQVFESNGKFLAKWLRLTIQASDITVDDADNIYLLTSTDIWKLDSSGKIITRWLLPSQDSPNALAGPTSIAVSKQGDMYVADFILCTITKFDQDGRFLTKWGGLVTRIAIGSIPLYSTAGNEEGQLNSPSQLALDRQGNVFVADSGNNRVQKFDRTGGFLGAWGLGTTGKGWLDEPYGLSVDTQNNVVVGDRGGIQKFRLK